MTYEFRRCFLCHFSNQYGCCVCEYFNDCLTPEVTRYRNLSFNVLINESIC